MESVTESQLSYHMNVGYEIGREAAVQEALTFHVNMLVAFVAKYPWLWKYGDGRGGAIFADLEHKFHLLGLERSPDRSDDASKPKRKPIKKSDLIAAMQRSDGRCVACGSKEDLEVDHIIPVAKGGTNDTENLQMLCKPCNMSKGAKSMEEWRGESS